MIEINIDPVAFFNVRWYGIMIALGIGAAVLWVAWQLRRKEIRGRIDIDTVLMTAIVVVPSGIIVARLLHVIDNIVISLLNPELADAGVVINYLQHPERIIGGDGLTIWGAILGGTLGAWIFSRFRKIDFGFLADLIVPGLVLAQIFGRVGCTINGCCYGDVCDLPWAVSYVNPASFAHTTLGVHPTQVYEIIYLFIVFGITVWLRNKLKPDGSIFLIYMTLYSLWRFGIDFIREGNDFLFGLHQAQFIGLVTMLITVPLIIMKTRWKKPEDYYEEPVEIPTEDPGEEE